MNEPYIALCQVCGFLEGVAATVICVAGTLLFAQAVDWTYRNRRAVRYWLLTGKVGASRPRKGM